MMQPNSKSQDSSNIDSTDREIIQLLRLDGRMSFTKIAQRLDVPETTVRYRVQRLQQQDIIRIIAWPNPEKTGKPHFMIVWFDVENAQIDAVAEQLSQMDEVQFLAVIAAGRFNIITDIYFKEHADLVNFFNQIHQISGIQHYESHLVLKLLKAQYSYVLYS